MPGKDSFGGTALDLKDYIIEQWAPGFLGSLSFDYLINNLNILALGVFAQLLKLGFNREHLTVFVIGGLAGIDKVAHRAKLLSPNKREEGNLESVLFILGN
ncbi:MAG: hypothetical protein ABH882_02865 [Candidatus Omnitrophota bacterium]